MTEPEGAVISEEVRSSQRALSILIIDDDEQIRSSLKLNLQLAGYYVQESAHAQAALRLLSEQSVDIVLCDLQMPVINGMEFIEQCKVQNPDTAVILMTGFGNHSLAIEAMRRGAYDYIAKPFDIQELVFTLRKVEEREQLLMENAVLRSEVEGRYSFGSIIAKSKGMQEVFEKVKRLSQFNTTVLVTGKSGTGKELLARAIHHNSPRRGGAFIAINCGAIPEALMESELFGHRKGAFTDASRDKRGLFEEADGGTLFLDEIGEMPSHLQVKLLRALQEQKIRRVGDEQTIPVDVRVIAATLRDLEQDVQDGRFREDLFYRLNVVAIHLPPLHERTEDIPVLADHFIQKHSKRLGLPSRALHPDALRALLCYEWRGNIRELENAIERALVMSDGKNLDVSALPEPIQRSFDSSLGGKMGLNGDFDIGVSESNLSIKQQSRSLEIRLIKRALVQTKGNRTHAARLLEISHRALLYKLKEYDLNDFGKD
ncbi:sigma-54-dependent Fis family transcriptional regulator [bacterium]|nr:sigma-54-dependent Fis family transcriptional regulator [bacterium]